MPLLSEILEARTSQSRSSSKRIRKKRSSSKNNNWKQSCVDECHADKNLHKKVTLIGLCKLRSQNIFFFIAQVNFVCYVKFLV